MLPSKYVINYFENTAVVFMIVKRMFDYGYILSYYMLVFNRKYFIYVLKVSGYYTKVYMYIL